MKDHELHLFIIPHYRTLHDSTLIDLVPPDYRFKNSLLLASGPVIEYRSLSSTVHISLALDFHRPSGFRKENHFRILTESLSRTTSSSPI